MNAPLFVFGAGPHGRVVREALDRAGRPVAGFVDDAPHLAGREVDGLRVHGAVEWFGRPAPQYAALGIGNNEARLAVIARLLAAGHIAEPAVDRSAVVAAGVHPGPGTFVAMLAGIGAGCHVATGVVVNTAARIDHDGVVENGAYLSPGVCCAGRVVIGARTFIGAGAVLGPGVMIGADAIVGAGSLVLDDLPPRSVSFGAPARVRRMREPGDVLDWAHLLGGKGPAQG